MKKIILIVFSIGLVHLVYAQFYFGPIGGYHANLIINQNNYGDSELGYDLDMGIEVGLMLGYQINTATGIQLNFIYSQMGQNYKDELFDGTAIKEVKLNYVQIPILLELLPFEYKQSAFSTKPSIYVLIGPQMSFLGTTEYLYTKRNGQDVGLPPGANSSHQLFNELDFEVVLEPGIQMYLNRAIFIKAGGRGVLGITDINEERFQIPNPEGKYGASRNATFGANIGIGILL